MAQDTVDAALAKSLKQAKSKPRNFALLASGTNCAKLLLDKKKITAAAVADAKKESKAKAAYIGVCEGDGGTIMVFKVLEEPSVSIAKLKKYITDNAGLSLKPRFEIVEEIIEVNEIGEDDGAPEASAAQAEVDAAKKKQFRDALVKVIPPVQRTLKSPHVPDAAKGELHGLIGQLKEDVKENRFDEAKAAIGMIVPIVKQHAPAAKNEQPRQSPEIQYRSSLVRWQQAKAQVSDEMAKVQAALRAAAEDGDTLAGKLDTALDDFYDQLDSALIDAINAPADQREASHKQATAVINQYKAEVARQPLIQHLQSNPFDTSVDFVGVLNGALAELESQLSA